MKDKLIKELKNIPDLPTNVIELDKFRKEDNIDTDKSGRVYLDKISKEHNVKVGFVRRENGSVKWVYIGSRCANCGVLASYLDWKVSYEPTEEMEGNI